MKIKTNELAGDKQCYASPQCEVITFHLQGNVLKNSIDEAESEDWGDIS